jgi:hypothetical protein
MKFVIIKCKKGLHSDGNHRYNVIEVPDCSVVSTNKEVKNFRSRDECKKKMNLEEVKWNR